MASGTSSISHDKKSFYKEVNIATIEEKADKQVSQSSLSRIRPSTSVAPR